MAPKRKLSVPFSTLGDAMIRPRRSKRFHWFGRVSSLLFHDLDHSAEILIDISLIFLLCIMVSMILSGENVAGWETCDLHDAIYIQLTFAK